jgi:hypothetical protein
MYFHKNVCELLLLADAHSCALLKDCAMDYIVNRYEIVKKSEDWKMVEQSNNLGMELFKFQNSRKCMISEYAVSYENSIPIVELLSRMEKAGLSLDGTKEMLLAHWKEHIYKDDESNKRQRTE